MQKLINYFKRKLWLPAIGSGLWAGYHVALLIADQYQIIIRKTDQNSLTPFRSLYATIKQVNKSKKPAIIYFMTPVKTQINFRYEFLKCSKEYEKDCSFILASFKTHFMQLKNLDFLKQKNEGPYVGLILPSKADQSKLFLMKDMMNKRGIEKMLQKYQIIEYKPPYIGLKDIVTQI